jgi:hypothetical protein
MKFDVIWSNGKEVRARMLEKENGNEQFPGLCGSYADAAVKEGYVPAHEADKSAQILRQLRHDCHVKIVCTGCGESPGPAEEGIPDRVQLSVRPLSGGMMAGNTKPTNRIASHQRGIWESG